MSTTTEPRVIRVALAGCGVVGAALVRLLRDEGPRIEAMHGVRLEVTRVLVRDVERPRPAPLRHSLLTADVDAFLAADADLVVEAMGGLDPALRIARATLAAGRRFVTANKALVAAHGAELAAIARRTGAGFDFEAAVGGGVPVVRALREALAGAGVRAVRGILNGTSNFILTRVSEGMTYDAALADAQRAGFAEADPSRDLDGRDAADKVAILAWLAFGLDPARAQVERRGILPDPDRLARDAAAFGGVPRLIAECVERPGGIAVVVEPVVVTRDSLFGATRDEENAIVVETRWNGRIRLAGPGAGGPPTASALLGDMIHPAPRVPACGGPEDSAPVLAVPDDRSHRWIVSVLGESPDSADSRGILAAAGIGIDEWHRGGRELRIRTAPCPREAIARAVAGLEAAGGQPHLARYEGTC